MREDVKREGESRFKNWHTCSWQPCCLRRVLSSGVLNMPSRVSCTPGLKRGALEHTQALRIRRGGRGNLSILRFDLLEQARTAAWHSLAQ